MSFCMTEIKISNNIYELKKEITLLQSELFELGDPVSNIPEMISSSNLLRTNEYLLKSDEKKTILSPYMFNILHQWNFYYHLFLKYNLS